MNKLQQSAGFSAIHTLLVIIIFAIVGFTGWYVWSENAEADDSSSSANSQNIKSTNKVSIPSDWQWFTSDDKTVKFAYPKSWGKLTQQLGDSTVHDSTSFIQPLTVTKKKDLLVQVPKGFTDYTWYLWDYDTDALVSAEDVKNPGDPQMRNYDAPVELGSKKATEAKYKNGSDAIYFVQGKGAMYCGVRHYFFAVNDNVVHMRAFLCDREGELPITQKSEYIDVVEEPLQDIYKYIR